MESFWFWKFSASVAGIGAVGLFVLFSLYKKWLSHPSLEKKMTTNQIFRLMRIFLSLTFATAALAIYAYMQGRPDDDNFSEIKLPIFGDIYSADDSFAWKDDGPMIPTSGKIDGVILQFSATNPNDFDITVDEIKVVVQDRREGKGEKSMGHGSGAGFQSTPQVTGEISQKPLLLPLKGNAGERYIIDAKGDQAHFAVKLKSQKAGLYTVKLFVTISALDDSKEIELESTVLALTDKATHSKHRGKDSVTYAFD